VNFQISFPRILTFSPWEKEHPLDKCTYARIIQAADHIQFAKAVRTFQPLPKGPATAAMAGEGKVITQLLSADITK
jgi:hypothetical protein